MLGWWFAQLIETADEEEGIAMCLAPGARHLVAAAIRHWVRRATNWPAWRDKVEVESCLP